MRLAAALACLVSLACACTRAADAPHPEAADPSRGETVRDALGREVAVWPRPERIASMTPANTEMLFGLGCGPRVVLRDRWSQYPPEVESLPVTDGFRLSVEQLAGWRPDLVLTSHGDPGAIEGVARAGMRVANFDQHSLDDVYATMRSVARLCHAPRDVEAWIADLRARVAAVRAAVAGRATPLVFVEVDATDPARPYTAGPGSHMAEVLSIVGARNLAQDTGRRWTRIAAEAVVRGDPDAILVMHDDGDAAQVAARPGWEAMRAVREHRVIDDLDAALLHRPGPRLIDGIERLARRLHPEAFPAPAR